MSTSENKLLGGLKTDGTGKLQFPEGVTMKHPKWNWFFENLFVPALSVLVGLTIGAVCITVLVKVIMFLSPFL